MSSQPLAGHPFSNLESLLDEIVRRLVGALHPEKVYLFGSQARGEATPDSDLDVLVIVEESELPGHNRDRLALRALRGLRAPVEVLVMTRQEFERKRQVVCSLPATIEREGTLLYAA